MSTVTDIRIKQAQEPATTADLRQRPQKYLDCERSNRAHRWGEISAIPENAPPSALFWAKTGDLWMDVCDRCTTIRYRGIDLLGNISWRWYDYPEDYKLQGRKGFKGADFRREAMRRRKAELKKANRKPRI